MFFDRLLRRPPIWPVLGFGRTCAPAFFTIPITDDDAAVRDIPFNISKGRTRRYKRMRVRYRQALKNVRMRLKGHQYARR